MSRKEFVGILDDDVRQLAFISLQDLKVSVYLGGEHDKLKWVTDLHWDLLVIDEAHEGVDTFKTDQAFNKIRRNSYLTPLLELHLKHWQRESLPRSKTITGLMLMSRQPKLFGRLSKKRGKSI